ncbi:transcriptional regulator [Enterocytozoon bieneusi H348]|nr:transcriptional regulator [Enterocytozoon bieneusi H348]|eukprot:XP_002649949.1 transcriptional regulator [Enterocytozoon bieneusi H348]
MVENTYGSRKHGKFVEITPMVLLSVVDHYKRQSYKRVIGILLGNTTSTKIIITNSFAVPFEENTSGFFLDTSYLQNMYDLFHKVNSKECIIGWYHSGPKIYKTDLDITKSIEIFCNNPILTIVNVHLKTDDIPVQAFQLNDLKQFDNLNVKIGADENEEIGVEHLLRDIKEGTGSQLKDKFNIIVNSLIMYEESLTKIINYLDPNKTTYSSKILMLLQEIINNTPKLIESVDMNEIYIGELINCLVNMNDLIKNRQENTN